MSLTGIFAGIVEKNGDPEKLGRIKVRVPGVYGIQGDVIGAIPVDDLPWALPMGMPAGGSNASGGLSMLPEVGDQVAVQFLDGEPEKPVWQWLMQTMAQAKNFQLHQYTATSQGASADVARAVFTRYGHSLELRPESVILTTSQGQQVLLQMSTSAAGSAATLQTPSGQSVALNDTNKNVVVQGLNSAVVSAAKVLINAPTSTLVKTGRFTLMVGSSMITIQGTTMLISTATGAAVVIDDQGNISINSAGGASVAVENDKVQIAEPLGTGLVIENGKISVTGAQMVVNTAAFSVGTAAGYPVLMLTPQMLAWIVGHTHTNGNEGSPTGAPIPFDPLFPTDSASLRMQTT